MRVDGAAGPDLEAGAGLVGAVDDVVPFGPSALATPANAVTVGRLVLSPAAVAADRRAGPVVRWRSRCGSLLAATDGVDG